MNKFEYASAKSTQQAIGLFGKQWGEAEILAGGTDLLSLMKDDVVRPKRVVNIKDIPELGGISFNAQRGLRIGALTKLVEVAEHPLVKQHYAKLAEDAKQLQNLGLNVSITRVPVAAAHRAAAPSAGQSDGDG